MSTTAGLVVVLAIAWASAIALYVSAKRLEYRDGTVQQREPDVQSPIWDGLQARHQRTAKVTPMPRRWVDEKRRIH